MAPCRARDFSAREKTQLPEREALDAQDLASWASLSPPCPILALLALMILPLLPLAVAFSSRPHRTKPCIHHFNLNNISAIITISSKRLRRQKSKEQTIRRPSRLYYQDDSSLPIPLLRSYCEKPALRSGCICD
ncbi:hypothetical protein BWQ96_06654 [Gracilariopsis chorda]|uniref:Uncharacterized protein n=1 Tax=Gracilariopsis chorda TaxID=448386 RepID=A0A2V3INF7_9FLOR|nr:hypothetical protein BWQ96_06654 [Gracilariopsis chorda]|eukprot:PXF43597.1 hypothetical protein BWQ96_06654 [Gracilariopsis chorda]